MPRSLSVLESLTHGIILEHLQKMGYEYTISLFALESGMGANQVVVCQYDLTESINFAS